MYSLATNLLGSTNDTASGSGTSVTGLLGFSVPALTQVIGASVDNHGATNNGVLTEQLDKGVLLGTLGNPVSIGGDVTQVTDVTVVVFGGTVFLTKRVEVGASRSATIGVVTEGVDVETSQSIGVVTRNFPRNGGGVVFRSLFEVNDTGDLRVTSNNSN